MAEGDDLRAIEHAVAELMRLASSPKLHDARLRATGLDVSRTQFRFLAHLEDAGEGSVTRLAGALDVSQPTASRTLAQLERAALVARRPDRTDGRVAIFEPTAKGRRVRRRLQAHMRDQLAQALDGMPAARRHDLGVLLGELVARVRTGGATGDGGPRGRR